MKTPNIELPELAQSESPAYVNLNDGFRALDAIVQLTVTSRSIAAPPNVEQGTRYIIPANPSGVWVGHAKHVTYKTAAGWDFRTPRKGWTAFVLDEGEDDEHQFCVYFDGLNWVQLVDNSSIEDLIDVRFITPPVDGDSLVYDGGLEAWVPLSVGKLTVTEIGSPNTSVEGITELQFDGAQVDQVDGTTARITVAGSGGGGSIATAYPGTIPDLQFWWESDDILASAGISVSALRDRTPWIDGNRTDNNGGRGAVGTATKLNGLPVLSWAASASHRYNMYAAPLLDKCSIFVVVKPTTIGAVQNFLCGTSSNSLQFRIETSGSLGLIQSGIAFIGTSTGALSAGTWYKCSSTYDSSSGAYAFRIAGAASGSGTNSKTINQVSNNLGFSPAGEDLNSMMAALIIYNRVLSGTEITDMETYLSAKWGV